MNKLLARKIVRVQFQSSRIGQPLRGYVPNLNYQGYKAVAPNGAVHFIYPSILKRRFKTHPTLKGTISHASLSFRL